MTKTELLNQYAKLIAEQHEARLKQDMDKVLKLDKELTKLRRIYDTQRKA